MNVNPQDTGDGDWWCEHCSDGQIDPNAPFNAYEYETGTEGVTMSIYCCEKCKRRIIDTLSGEDDVLGELVRLRQENAELQAQMLDWYQRKFGMQVFDFVNKEWYYYDDRKSEDDEVFKDTEVE